VAADDGRRHLCGVDVTALSEDEEADLRFATIGFCFQGFLLSPTLTARENVILPGLPRHLDFDARTRADELLDQVGLSDRMDHLPSQLSGGEQQRVALARSLFANPPVVLIDEPTGNLDRAAARTIAELLRQLRAGGSRSLLVATHDPLVIGIADRVLALEDGRLVPSESDLFSVKHEL
jgi:putative ABC transport system ATP-binding protein